MFPYTHLSLIPPIQLRVNGHDCPSSPPQEFIVVKTPEPPALAILGVDFSAIGVLIFFLRRKIATS